MKASIRSFNSAQAFFLRLRNEVNAFFSIVMMVPNPLCNEGNRLLSTGRLALLGIRTARDIVVPLAMEATDESKKLGRLGA
jgi:hypothetical protein